jgi:predicted DNA-binding ribbon-helix-helix protein
MSASPAKHPKDLAASLRHNANSLIRKRSIILDGHKTSVSLEDAFWQAFKEIAGRKKTTVFRLASEVDRQRECDNLSSAIRLFVLAHYQHQPDAEPPVNAADAE